MSDEQQKYTAADIQILEGLEGVRKRPAMYIGDTGKKGIHHLIYEIVDNSIDEALAGYCKNIIVVLLKDGSVLVADDGRGIPVEKHSSGKSALEVVTTTLHSGGKFEKNVYKVSGGLHGVGIAVVNALSQTMQVEVHREGKAYRQRYSYGKPISQVEAVGETKERGTIVTFKPDAKIFNETSFDYDYLKEYLMELAFLNSGLAIKLRDFRGKEREEVFHYEGGLVEFITYLNRNRKPLHSVFYSTKQNRSLELDFALQYTDSYNNMVYSFVNDIKTTEGGTHLAGFKTALTRAVNDYLKSNKIWKNNDQKAAGDDALEGITAVISLKIAEPQFEGQTKTKLGNTDVKGIVDSLIYDSLKTYFEETPDAARVISQKIMRTIEAREAAQKAKDLIRRKGVFETSILPGKLADCSEKDPSKCELYLVEGDSAGGSSKMARDRAFQAILPLRGKILNVEKSPIHKILTSNEIKNIILTLGCGFGEDFDINKVRYHKICIMCDADVDGAHIRTLLLTLFYRHYKSIIERGYLYIAQPPLYKIKKGKVVSYAYSDAELDRSIKELGDGCEIQRYKGLGEMNPDQLWDTTMDPGKRTLKRVMIEDAMKADELFTLLMGEEVEPRREFIQAHAAQVKNLDI